jgi:hypothetical protein
VAAVTGIATPVGAAAVLHHLLRRRGYRLVVAGGCACTGDVGDHFAAQTPLETYRIRRKGVDYWVEHTGKGVHYYVEGRFSEAVAEKKGALDEAKGAAEQHHAKAKEAGK